MQYNVRIDDMKMIGSGTVVMIFLLMVWGAWNCKDSVTGVSPIVFPPSNISFGKYVQPLFFQECAVTGCHTQDSKAEAGDLSLESWGEAMSSPLVIIPGDSVGSLLVVRIEGKNARPLMPPLNTNFSLNRNQINGLKQWIYEGAKNN